METLTIGIATQDIDVTTINNMDIYLRTALEHILEEIIVDGWAKLHALVVTKLVMWEKIAQQDPTHLNLNLAKAKKVENVKNEMNKT